MNDLIERIEAASGPDRRLNADLLLALGWFGDKDGAFDPKGNRARTIPDYLGSIDAALTLVPEGWTWMLDTMEGRNEACVHGNGPVPDSAYVTAATPALALCAAALKSRAYLKETNNAD